MKWVRRLFRTASEAHAEGLRADSTRVGATATCDCRVGQLVEVYGTVQALTLRPGGRIPMTEVQLWDGAGVVTLLWWGRECVRGVTLGRTLSAQGRIAAGVAPGSLVIYNPRYQLATR